ncbi:MAG: hypothetical protein KUG83_10825 [Gammaproteobacteria bacterium]|nr:hypothetical protein [Gammaproteobacteria bacterium]
MKERPLESDITQMLFFKWLKNNACVFLLAPLISQQSVAAPLFQSDAFDFDAILRLGALSETAPKLGLLAQRQSSYSQSASLRGALNYRATDQWSFQGHGLVFYDNRDQWPPVNASGLCQSGVTRHAIFCEQHDRAPIVLTDIDRLNLQYAHDGMGVTIGRQAINLASTFYFSPNDIFAPFGSSNFYRIYKPGVDAFRFNRDVGELGQFDLFLVTGNPSAMEGSVADRGSLLIHYSNVLGNFEWSLMGGTVYEQAYAALGLQGELFNWLGVRAEGQLVNQDKPSKNEQMIVKSYTVGLEHRWENSFDLRVEYYFNGYGKKQTIFSIPELLANNSNNLSPYLGREYLAMGQGYQLSALTYLQFLWMFNVNNNAEIFYMDINHSLSNNTEFNMSVSLPDKHASSEFSGLSRTLGVELRAYF